MFSTVICKPRCLLHIYVSLLNSASLVWYDSTHVAQAKVQCTVQYTL